MKDGLENSFKNSLNDFELPYDAQAWESLSKKLGTKKWYQTSRLKWSAAIVAAIGIAAYFVLPGTKTTLQIENQVKTIQKGSTSTASQIKVEQTTSKKTQKRSLDEPAISLVPEVVSIPNSSELLDEFIPHSIPLVLDQMEVLGLSDKVIDHIDPTPSYNGAVAMIDFKNRCQGETLQLEADKHHERMINYAGKTLRFSYNEAISLKLTEPGKVTLTANSGPYGQFEEFGSFDVNSSPVLSINADRTITYEDGLPKITCQAESNESQISWHSTYALKSNSGKNVEVFAFDKGYAIVEAQVTSSNGCITKEKEMIQIPSDYNLLAVNAFNPQSQDSRNSTFMPYALTIRQTPFRLVVLDPDNGGLVFETSDVGNAWDGIDRRDGKLVPGNKAYIWKVVIQHPVQGEKGEYRGTIVRM
jgi:hypothetical protein